MLYYCTVLHYSIVLLYYLYCCVVVLTCHGALQLKHASLAGGNARHDGCLCSILRALPGLPAVRCLQRWATIGCIRKILFFGDSKRSSGSSVHWSVRAHGGETGEIAVAQAAIKRLRQHSSRIANIYRAPLQCTNQVGLSGGYSCRRRVQPGGNRIAWLVVDDPFC